MRSGRKISSPISFGSASLPSLRTILAMSPGTGLPIDPIGASGPARVVPPSTLAYHSNSWAPKRSSNGRHTSFGQPAEITALHGLAASLGSGACLIRIGLIEPRALKNVAW